MNDYVCHIMYVCVCRDVFVCVFVDMYDVRATEESTPLMEACAGQYEAKGA